MKKSLKKNHNVQKSNRQLKIITQNPMLLNAMYQLDHQNKSSKLRFLIL